jgi:putative methyltransferase
VVLDATAAPGNKTSHLSALMSGRGKVGAHCVHLRLADRAERLSQLFAFERDHHRFKTLNMMLGKARCTNVTPVNADFLTINPLEPQYAGATHMSVLTLHPR